MGCYNQFAKMVTLGIIATALPGQAIALEVEEKAAEKSSSYKYHLTNIGETNVDPTTLHNKKSGSSLAPVINNDGQVIGNRAKGGFLRDPSIGEWAPYINGVVINFHSLTNDGDILVSLNRNDHPQEWMIWPTTTGKNGSRQRIDTDAHNDAKFVFTGLTNDRMAVGNIVSGENTKPFYWKGGAELHFLNQGDGKTQYVNNQNQIVGVLKIIKIHLQGCGVHNRACNLLKISAPNLCQMAKQSWPIF